MNDRYTKGCLTVIAVLLAAIVLRGHPPVAPPAKPAPEVQKVIICHQDFHCRLTKENCGGYAGFCATLAVKVVSMPSVHVNNEGLLVSNDGSFAR